MTLYKKISVGNFDTGRLQESLLKILRPIRWEGHNKGKAIPVTGDEGP
jgi:hypothetical protein